VLGNAGGFFFSHDIVSLGSLMTFHDCVWKLLMYWHMKRIFTVQVFQWFIQKSANKYKPFMPHKRWTHDLFACKKKSSL